MNLEKVNIEISATRNKLITYMLLSLIIAVMSGIIAVTCFTLGHPGYGNFWGTVSSTAVVILVFGNLG